MTHVPSDPLLGHVLEDRYVIESRIARGGMAIVYQGVDRRLHRKVAIKVMHPHLAEDEDFKKRFEQEARNAAKLAHPNLVSVLDQGEESGIVFLVMEHVPGVTLRDLLRQQQFLTTTQTLEISEAILLGLSAAHEAGIIHRDLKPENVLLADDGRIKLGDFGLARAAGTNTATGQALLGTIAYLSPELVTRGIADKQSDIYAFGIMLYEMLTGTQPFKGEQPMQVAYKHAHEEIPAPSALSQEATPWLDELVRWATEKDPAKRPANATELLAALRRQLPASATTGIQHTTVLNTDPLTRIIPETPGAHEASLASEPFKNEPNKNLPVQTSPLSQEIKRAKKIERRRRLRGLLIFLITLALIFVSFGASWWHFLGPGSDIVVPNVLGEKTQAAQQIMDESFLQTTVTECTHLEIEPGHIVSTDPEPNTRVKRESTVELCESIGPAQLSTPKLMGMQLEEAISAIEKAGFIFGEVIAEMFTDAPIGEVLEAYTEDGEPLPDELAEASTIDLLTSAGPLMKIRDVSISDAIEMLEKVQILVDEDAIVFDYSDDYKKDQVMGIIILSDPVYRGDTVTLHVSLGPELFAVPDVTELTVREAMNLLSDYGFEPKAPWYLNDAALDSFKAKGTTPAAGEMLPLGSSIEVNPKIL